MKGLIKYDSKKIFGTFKIQDGFILCSPIRVEELVLEDKFDKKISFKEWFFGFGHRWEYVWVEVPKRHWNSFKVIPEHLVDEVILFENGKEKI